MTENQIISGFCEMIFRDRKQNKVFPNVFINKYEADLLEISKSGYAYEYEIKTSIPDFKNDHKKSCGFFATIDTNWEKIPLLKKDVLKDGKRVNYFYYIVPDGMISSNDVPDYAGLMYATEGEFTAFIKADGGKYSVPRMYFKVIKPAPKLSTVKASETLVSKCLESTYYRYHNLRTKLIADVVSSISVQSCT